MNINGKVRFFPQRYVLKKHQSRYPMLIFKTNKFIVKAMPQGTLPLPSVPCRVSYAVQPIVIDSFHYKCHRDS
jgi:hypothetical protein